MSVNYSAIRALTFDVFGTVVDWRGSIIRESRKFGASRGLRLDWAAFADAWRAGYRPAMDRVRRGEMPWLHIDRLHRMILDEVLARFGATGVAEDDREQLNQVWHRLRPWPDAVRGLRRLKQKFIIATLSNGNVSLLTDMAKHSALPWDCILSAELFHHYKPDPETYLGAAALLGARPEQTMMVAAHEDDLKAARAVGLRTAFVRRPREHGRASGYDLPHDSSFDVIADDFVDLAEKMGA
ncbi:MAG TPA: haloacid dehalogenase type II [Burkholderiales bacterium]|nr:haloacid dehalogenase type II [Burkholderiales bacterium]